MSNDAIYRNQEEQFLLANRQLPKLSTISLLLSNSFGTNAVFYAAWLGYSIGAWALVIQLAWTISFLLLGRYAAQISGTWGLHEIISTSLRPWIRQLAAAVTLLGMLFLLNWEIAIANSALDSVLPKLIPGNHIVSAHTSTIAILLVCVTLAYTATLGMRGTGLIDKCLNLIKIITFLVLTAITAWLVLLSRHTSPSAIFLPRMSDLVQNLGIVAFFTNLVFNLAWQFVDMTTWQTSLAGSHQSAKLISINLRRSGWVVFYTIGLVGTIFGMLLRQTVGVTDSNIFTIPLTLSPSSATLIASITVVCVAACFMTFMDGLFLASGQIGTVDLSTLTAPIARISPKAAIRTACVLFAASSVWGVSYVMRFTGGSIFDFVYIVIVAQLSLFGPAFCALKQRRLNASAFFAGAPILVSLLFGIALIIVGTVIDEKTLIDIAGSATIALSLLISFAITKSTTNSNA